MVVTKQEMIDKLNSSEKQNIIIKTNFYAELLEEVMDDIRENDIESYNVKVDMSRVNVMHLLTYIMAELRDRHLFNPSFTYSLPFQGRSELRNLEAVLRGNNLNVKFICYNMDNMSEKDQELFNELYYFDSKHYNIVSLVSDDFITYNLYGNRYLTENEDYESYALIKDKTKNLTISKKTI